jgi:hypothetical protein
MLLAAPFLVSALLGSPAEAVAPAAPTTSAEPAGGTADAHRVVSAESPTPRSERRFHLGLEGRADVWRHPLRLATGVQLGTLDLSLIADPGAFVDGKHEADLLVGWWFAPHAWQVVLGYRNSSMPVLHGRRFEETLLLGLDAALPKIDGKHLRATVGVTLALDLYRHGGGVPARSLPTRVADLADFVSLGFNVRFEWAGAL